MPSTKVSTRSASGARKAPGASSRSLAKKASTKQPSDVKLPPIVAKTPVKPSAPKNPDASPRNASTAASASTPRAPSKKPTSSSSLRKAAAPTPSNPSGGLTTPRDRSQSMRGGGARAGALPSTPGQAAPTTGGRLTKEQRKERDEKRRQAAVRIQRWFYRCQHKLDWRLVVEAARQFAREEAIRQAEQLRKAKIVLRRFFRWTAWRLRVVRRERNMLRQRACAHAVQTILVGKRSEYVARKLLFNRLCNAALLILARWKDSAAFARVRWRKANEEVRTLLDRKSSVERRSIECAEEAEFLGLRCGFRAAPPMRRHVDAVALERLEEAAQVAEAERLMVLKADHVGGGRRLVRGLSRANMNGSMAAAAHTHPPSGDASTIRRTGSTAASHIGGNASLAMSGLPAGGGVQSVLSDAPGSMRWTQRLGQQIAASKARTLTATQVKAALNQRRAARHGGPSPASPFTGGMSFDDSYALARRDSAAAIGAPAVVEAAATGSSSQAVFDVSGGLHFDADDVDANFGDGDDRHPVGAAAEDLSSGGGGGGGVTEAAGAVDSSSLTWLLNAPQPKVAPDTAAARRAKQETSRCGVGADWHTWFRRTDYGRRSAAMQIVDEGQRQQEAAQVSRPVHDHAIERLLVQESARRRRMVQQYEALAHGLMSSAAAERRRASTSAPGAVAVQGAP